MKTELPEPAEYYRPTRARELREKAARLGGRARVLQWLSLLAAAPVGLWVYVLVVCIQDSQGSFHELAIFMLAVLLLALAAISVGILRLVTHLVDSCVDKAH